MTNQPNSRYKIPYPANTPQYSKFWRLIHLDKKTHEDALEIMKTWEPRGKNGYRRPVPAQERTTDLQETKEPVPPLPTPDPLQDKPVAKDDLARVATALEKIAVLLGGINGSLHKICDSSTPGATGAITLQQRPGTSSTQPPRSAENGLVTGCKVKRVSTGEVGQVTRIMPGLKEVEVKFMLGTKTLPADQLVEA